MTDEQYGQDPRDSHLADPELAPDDDHREVGGGPPTSQPGALYEMSAARTKEQLAYMEQLEADGICIFCPEHVASHHREPVEWSGEFFYVTKNDYPYAGTVAHYLIVPHQHVRSFDELPDAAGAELWAIKRMLKEQLGALATATVERSGDMRYNGGSVAHLHTHFVALPPDPEKTVRFKVSAAAP